MGFRNPPDPDDEYDQQELEELAAEPWMLDLLKLNPEYTGWGPHKDYMWKEGDGWNSRVIKDTWDDFVWELDELNELVNFYFEVSRPQEKCARCGETGYNPATKRISDGFYDFDGLGARWCENITQDEVDCLVEHGRLFDFYPSHEDWVKAQKGEAPRPKILAEDVNNGQGKALQSHDAINRSILIECRAKRLGVYGLCEQCHGNGCVVTGPARVSLILWWLHPRKGCSRGIEITHIKQEELPAVFALLQEANDRNQARFAAVVAMTAK